MNTLVETVEALERAPPREYSKAFENLVEGPKDVVGLLAYALLKQSVAENAKRGYQSEAGFRDPGEATRDMYRSSATQMLSDFAAGVIDDAREEIQQGAILERLGDAEARINTHMDGRTSFGSALLTSFVGWLLTVAVSVLVLVGAAASGLGDYFLNGLQKAVQSPAAQTETAAPPQQSPQL